jgi:hypothetical protein
MLGLQKVMGRAGMLCLEWKRWGHAFVMVRDLRSLSQIT